MRRSSGILLHPTSLPGQAPLGDIGPEAYAWIDWLHDAGVRWWQVLPINPPGFAASPYQAFSAFAGNTMLISPDLLLADGLIDEIPQIGSRPGPVYFGYAETWKQPIVAAAARRLPATDAYRAFCETEAFWLDEYALFVALKKAHNGSSYAQWPDSLRLRDPGAVAAAAAEHRDAVELEKASQFIFFDQWRRLHAYATDRGVGFIGDAPIFVAEDSAEVWTRPELFDLDENRRPRTVAGVPPDYFTEAGQLWGNPQYDWQAHADEGFAWWISRIRSLTGLVDMVRIDHFRAFADYWEIPAGSPTAEHGRWVLGPGRPFFDAVRSALGELPLIAEDLGELHEIVPELRDAVGLPGMQIGQFAFGPDDTAPDAWDEHTVGYTGTHDNDTGAGWWASSSRAARARASRLGGIGSETPALDLIRAVWRSPSVIAVAQAQDLLQLGTEARMNLPGTVGPHNWTWRLESLPAPELASWLRDLNLETGR